MTALVIAVIALVGTLATAGLSLYGQLRAARREAEGVLRKYREPLVGAAYELQGRLYNIVEREFLRRYYVNGDDAQRTYAHENTLYVVAQYLGWSEILRREIQLLAFSDSERTRSAALHQRRIVEILQSDEPELGRCFLLWRGEQRAIGELMIDTSAGHSQCLGYAGFLGRREPEFRHWFERLESQLDELAVEQNPRLVQLQHALVDLIRELDPKQTRYSDDVLRKV